ncbi:hypothetical protein QFC24_001909 [Naganishia onofrii]|uniref:Uncharacterized protein n=1 Tax=Naganishia onofrii TaxID=1851511 RepID=A0ACC2XTD7_9TREE|nr:hypothetical protein QFC24_001909 [Naganishia onofrii]
MVMGGNAFIRSNVTISRIEDQLYKQLADAAQQVLNRYYSHVLLPPSAPGKVNHGDIDLLVSESLETEAKNGKLEDIVGRELRAQAVFRNNAMTSYAIPHPTLPDVCVQLDTQLCEPEYLSWVYFITSYGDLVPILGSIHHKFGLIINDKGFWVQLDLPKTANMCGIPRAKMVVFLTLEPGKMLEFLGLDAGRYQEGRANEEEIFEWIRGGKFFRPMSRKTGDATTQSTESKSAKINSNVETSHPSDTPVPKRRMLTAFANYSHNYAATPLSASSPGDIALEAGKFFDKQQEYETALRYCLSEVQDFEFWQQVRSGLSGNSSRKARIIRSLKKWVVLEDGKPSISEHPVDRSDVAQGSEAERTGRLGWIKEHWEEVYEKEKRSAAEASGKSIQHDSQ